MNLFFIRGTETFLCFNVHYWKAREPQEMLQGRRGSPYCRMNAVAGLWD